MSFNNFACMLSLSVMFWFSLVLMLENKKCNFKGNIFKIMIVFVFARKIDLLSSFPFPCPL